MIPDLIKRLNAMGLDLTPEEIADILWLADHLEKDSADPDLAEISRAKDSPKDRAHKDSKKPADTPEPPRKSEAPGTEIYDSGFVRGTGAIAAMHVRSPGGSALPGELSISRSLRPLMRKIPSRSRFVLDEDATVQQIADADNWAPVYVPALSRWLDLVLLVDESPSMLIWQETVGELKQLLERQAAFRDVAIWGFRTEDGNDLLLHRGIGFGAWDQPVRSPRELIDPRGQRLILLISDCVSPAWYDGRVARMAANWADKNMMAVIQVLPERLWRRTGLGRAIPVYLRGLMPGTANAKLETRSSIRAFSKAVPDGLKLPVITLEPHSLKPWAMSVAGIGGLWIPGVVFPEDSGGKDEKPAQQTDSAQKKIPTPEERLQFFRATASPQAWKLAGYLSAAPLSLPVMRLVQRVMLPESRQIHLAEFFLSGLTERLTPEDAPVHPDAVQYDFIGDIREQLLTTVYISESLGVLEKVSEFIGENIGKPLDFHALLADPAAADGIFIEEGMLPFANVAATVLQRLGGNYRQLAERLAEKSAYPKRITNSLGMEFVYIPPGEFMMGSPIDEPGHMKNEIQHKVRLKKGFYMQIMQVTKGQWKQFVAENPNYKGSGENIRGCRGMGEVEHFSQADTHPVVCVSWNESQAFIRWLNQREKTDRYRLPTEAEWEYACRSGSETAYCFGDDENLLSEYAWYLANSGQKTHSVGQKKPNAWGLYDMHGNVWEWCLDRYAGYSSDDVTDPAGPDKGSIKVVRGGSWLYGASLCRSAYRSIARPGYRDYYSGFRILKESAYPKRITNSLGMEFVYIEPGEFMMGSPEDEPGRSKNETQHRVTLTKGFYMQTTQVTQGQWKAVMGNNPSRFKDGGDNCPLEKVSWDDTQAFIKKVNQLEKTDRYRLPTEAEWEYACRAGTTKFFFFGNCLSTDQANYNGNYPLEGCPKGEYREKTVPVASFDPNAWGLYDMHGNVYEWCQDWYGDYPTETVTDPAGPGRARTESFGAAAGSASLRTADRRYATRDRLSSGTTASGSG
jgi:formylglycine-generating enzyme required for sulfatase activity